MVNAYVMLSRVKRAHRLALHVAANKPFATHCFSCFSNHRGTHDRVWVYPTTITDGEVVLPTNGWHVGVHLETLRYTQEVGIAMCRSMKKPNAPFLPDMASTQLFLLRPLRPPL